MIGTETIIVAAIAAAIMERILTTIMAVASTTPTIATGTGINAALGRSELYPCYSHLYWPGRGNLLS